MLKNKIKQYIYPDNRISGFIGLLLLGVLIGLAALAQTLNTLMPAPVSELDAGSTRFSEERTWKHFNIIYGNGPKVAGSPEHLKATYDLKELLDEIALTATKSVQIDHQIISGDFLLEFSTPFVNAYQDVSNIIALIKSDTGANTTLLVNCHYDSVPTSPGASDDIIWCAVMVEVFFIMSRQSEAIEHNIVFLFNGAEENPFQGAHGFLKHLWAEGINGLINLEAAGLGGRATVFQVNDPRIVSHYSNSVPQPSAQSLGEALFRAGLILSDTDFRIFRDFGDIKGVDIAFHTYGHVYHTPYDSSHLFNDGLIQHSGETLLPLVKSLSALDTLESTVSLEGAVYYDYVGVFMLTYSYNAAIGIDIASLLITIYSVIHTFVFNLGYKRETLWEFAWHIASRFLAAVAGSLAILLAFGLMYASTMPMRYYSRQWLLVPLYWMPFLLGAVWASIGFDYWREKKTNMTVYTRTELAMAATRAIWALVLLVMLAAHNVTVPMTYVVTVPLVQVSLVAIICSLVFIKRKVRGGVLWLSLYLFLLIPSLLFSFNISISAFNLFIPILGRSGHSMPYPDLVLGGLNILCILITFMGLSGVELQFSRKSTGIVSILLLILSLVGIFVPFNPYSGDIDRPSPQRYQIRHIIRTFHNFDGSIIASSSGFLIPPQDINSPNTIQHILESNFGYYARTSNMSQFCDYEQTCGFPVTTPSREVHVLRSEWIETGPPNAPLAPTPTASITRLQKVCQYPVCVITLLITGAPHQSLQITPRTTWSLVKWNLDTSLFVTSEFQGRPTYFIYYCRGTFSDNPDPFILELTLETNQTGVDLETIPAIDISHSVHRTHHGHEMTQQMADLIDDLPEWVIVVPFISSLDVYIF